MNTPSAHSNNRENLEETTPERIHLPEPDTDNITVLTHKLPNKPILPWNHYDSPWNQEQEATNGNGDEDLETVGENETVSESHSLNEEEEWGIINKCCD